MRSKLIKLEREISRLMTNRIGRRAAARPVASTGQPSVAEGYIKMAKTRIAAIATSLKRSEHSFLIAARALLSAIRGISIPANALHWKVSSSAGHAVPLTRRAPGKTKTRSITGILFAVSFGSIAILSILSVLLILQVKDMEKQIAQWRQELSVAFDRLARTENQIKKIATSNSVTAATHQRISLFALSLTDADKKLIRQFIVVPPPEPGAKPKIHLGDKISDTAGAPIPDALTDELPKLHGARFLVDQDGTIVITAQGSDRADALIAYQQPH